MVGLLRCNDPEVGRLMCRTTSSLPGLPKSQSWDEISIPLPSILLDSAEKRGSGVEQKNTVPEIGGNQPHPRLTLRRPGQRALKYEAL